MLAARVPECQHKESAVLSLVVDEVPDATEKEAPYTWSSRSFILCSHTWLLGQQGNSFAEVGADRSWSLLELATRVSAAMGVVPDIQHLPARHEVQHAHSTHDKVRRVFGVRPETTLEDGLSVMAAWVREQGARTSAPFAHLEITRNMPPAWLPS